jgi:hypothetical protein
LSDLAAYSTITKSRDGAEMPICDFNSEPFFHQAEGDTEPRAMYLTLVGPESEKVRRALAQMQHRSDKNKDNHSPSDLDIEKELVADCKMLASLTIGGLLFWRGEWRDVTSENVVEVYADLLLIRAQVIKFCLDPKKFVAG